MKITPKTFPIALALLMVVALKPMAAHAQAEPQLTIESERAAHPRIVQAINSLNVVITNLNAAPTNFGGYKAQAITNAATAIFSLKKALYYRLNMDDEAIRKAQ
jgi:uncharacterized membrane protein